MNCTNNQKTKKNKMKNIFLYFSLLLLFVSFGFGSFGQVIQAQSYDNEWIDFNKSYFKFYIEDDGVYRIAQSALLQAGIPLQADGIKIFNNGAEIPIFVKSQGDGSLGVSDYIEFYATENDGSFDTQLFLDEDWQISTETSLFTKQSAYYIVYDNSSSGLRYTTISNDISVVPPKDLSFANETNRRFQQEYFDGKPDTRIWAGVNSYLSDFGQAEGYVSTVITAGANQSYTVLTPEVYQTGNPEDSVDVEVKLIGRSSDIYINTGDHHIRLSVNGTVYVDDTYEGYNYVVYNFKVPLSAIESSNSVTLESVGDVINEPQYQSQLSQGVNIYPNYPLGPDRNSIAYVKFNYPHSFDFENTSSFKFNVKNDDVHYFEIENFNGGNAPILYDLTGRKRLFPVFENGVYKIRINPIPSLPPSREFIISSVDAGVEYIPFLQPVDFIDFSDPQIASDYLVITHSSLKEPFQNVDQIQRYKEYRESEAGGAYKVLVVDIDDIYEQFGYGIKQHPQSFRNFCNYIIEQGENGNWAIAPQYLYLLGKSIRYNRCTTSPENFANNLVPTFGSPGSDNLWSAPTNYNYKNRLSTGRLSAKSNLEVKEYLDKVIEYETIQNTDFPCDYESRKWLKDILHIASGESGSEEVDFVNNLISYENIAESPKFGGNVLATLSSATPQVVQSPITDYMNNGLNLITFFGHSNGEFWKYDIGEPEQYDNEGLYPFIFSSSCFVGDIHKPFTLGGEIMAENFTLAYNRGAIGYLASVRFGFPSLLHQFSTALYNNFSNTLYGEPMALCIQKSIADIYDPEDIGIKLTSQEFTLSCDPAIKLHHFARPEYILENSSVSFDPPTLSAALDSFDILLDIWNMGMAVEDSIEITIEQILPNGEIGNVLSNMFPSPAYNETIPFTFPLQTLTNPNPIGENTFNITINSDQALEEDCTDNNFVEISELVLPTTALPLEPCQFAILGDQDLVLKASSSLPVLQSTEYIFQIDTTLNFNSSLFKQGLVESQGGIIEWPSTIPLLNETVYYWRVSVNPNAQQEYSWEASSFIFINDEDDGWNQSHYFQFLQDSYSNSYLNEDNRLFEYDDIFNELYCRNTFSNNFSEASLITYSVNNSTQVQNSCLLSDVSNCGGGINIAAFSPSTLSPIMSMKVSDGGSVCTELGQYNDIHCTTSDKPVFQFHTGSVDDLTNVNNFINDIPDGYYILAYSINEHRLTSNPVFGDALQPIHDFFSGLGVDQFSNIPLNSTFITFGKKNDPDFDNRQFIFTTDPDSILVMDIPVASKKDRGDVVSTIVGPAKNWNRLFWDYSSIDENENLDVVSINVYGIDNSNNQVLLLNTGVETAWELSNYVDAEIYPNILLEAVTKDTIEFTMPQLNKWRVLFDRYPEAALNQNLGYVFNSDTIAQGSEGYFEMAVTNITDIDMDSLLVSFIITDQNNQTDTTSIYYDPLLANSTNTIAHNFATAGFSGDSFFKAIINPGKDQVEKFDFNNQIVIPFHILSDQVNPILDVTFDGIHIMDGDIVATSPEIRIKITDENLFVALDENSAQIAVVDAAGSLELIDLNDENVSITIPSQEEIAQGKNCVEIIYQPTFISDGTYQLQVVGYDKSGNLAGENEYSVSFEIITESMITQVLNYPNPFTTSTRFVFTLTGAEIPENLKIQVFSVSGKVVREFTALELGNIHIGKNMSEPWDGTDQFGNELANGVYFYRVTANSNGEDIKLFTVSDEDAQNGRYNMSSTEKMDELFGSKGIGKLYKMR